MIVNGQFRRIRARELSSSGRAQLETVLKASLGGTRLQDVLDDVAQNLRQLWRYEDAATLVTKSIQLDHKKELLVEFASGREVFKNFFEILAELYAFAASEGCSIVTWVNIHEALIDRYNRMLNSQAAHTVHVSAVPPVQQESTGIGLDVLVATPAGPKFAYNLKIGDKLLGRNGEQEIVGLRRAMIQQFTVSGIGVDNLVADQDGEWAEAKTLELAQPARAYLALELSVEPDHEFTLVDGRVIHNLGGGGGSSQTTSSAPWSEAVPYYQQLFQQAGNALNQQSGPTADQTSAWNTMRQNAAGAGAGGQEFQQMALDMLNGRYLDPATNPTLRANVSAAAAPITDSFTQSFLPNVTSQAIQGGAYGGSRQGVVESLGQSETARQVGNISAQMYGDNYNRERQNQLNSPMYLAQALGLQNQGANSLLDISNQQRQAQQQPLSWFSSILGSAPFSSTTQTGNSSGSTLGGLAGLGSMFGGLFGQSGAFPDFFSGLGGLFSGGQSPLQIT